MCNQRERLIGYVYDEGDAADRDEVRRHLEACGECREEIAALRSVREDLLAWDVPAHESVWKPFAPAPVVSWWRQVPVWARAAAAGLVFAAGAAGGAAVQAVGAQNGEYAGATAVSAEQVAADVAAAEERILASFRATLERVQAVQDRVQPASLTPAAEATHAQLVNEVARLQAQNSDYLEVIARIFANLDGVRDASNLKYASLETKINNLMQVVSQAYEPVK